MFLGILNASLSRFYGGRGGGGMRGSPPGTSEDLWQLSPSRTAGPEHWSPPADHTR